MAATKALGDPDGAHDNPDVVHEAPDLSSEKHPDAVEQRYRKEGGTTQHHGGLYSDTVRHYTVIL